jgi:hypothetical protein
MLATCLNCLLCVSGLTLDPAESNTILVYYLFYLPISRQVTQEEAVTPVHCKVYNRHLVAPSRYLLAFHAA